jgi:ribosomal-protein-alanine N-acetyltransferase
VSAGPYAQILANDLRVQTARFVLSPLCMSDAPDFFAHLSDEAVVEFMDIEPLGDVSQAEGIISWAEDIRTAGVGVRWAVRDNLTGAFVGSCGFNTLVWERGCRGEVAYDVARSRWGERVMDEVLPPVLDIGFRTLGLRRIEAMVTVGNAPSGRLLERHGFEREGLLREHAFWKDRFWDQLVYARLG